MDERNIQIRMHFVERATENLLSRAAAQETWIYIKDKHDNLWYVWRNRGVIETEPALYKVKQDCNIEPYTV